MNRGKGDFCIQNSVNLELLRSFEGLAAAELCNINLAHLVGDSVEHFCSNSINSKGSRSRRTVVMFHQH